MPLLYDFLNYIKKLSPKSKALFLFYIIMETSGSLNARKKDIHFGYPFSCFESARRDSNPRPRPWQGRTPPTEPLAHIWLLSFGHFISYHKSSQIASTFKSFFEIHEKPMNKNNCHIQVPWTGIEPVTRGFSVLCSTNWATKACLIVTVNTWNLNAAGRNRTGTGD